MKYPRKIALAAAAAVLFTLILTLLTACGGSGTSSVSKGLEARLDYAVAKVTDFSHFEIRNNALFSEDAFCKANAAAMMLSGRDSSEEHEKIVRLLKLDSLTAADENGVIVMSYPAEEVGKRLKETDKKAFSTIVKNISTKEMSEPVPNGDGTYTIMAGVKREDGTGAVIISFTSDSYAEVCGDDLASACGPDTVVIKDNVVISSTFEGASVGSGDSAVNMTSDVLSLDSFNIKVGDKSYICMAKEAGGYTVVCAEPV